MKKEELIKRNVELEARVKGMVELDEIQRRDFALAFEWYKKRSMYDTIDELRTPKWSEVFVEIGKLLAKQQRLDYIAEVENLHKEIQRLHATLQEKELK